MLYPLAYLFLVSFVELFFPRERRISTQLFNISVFVVFFINAIKYYYGPDVLLYIPIYEKVEDPWTILTRGTHLIDYEIGFVFYCSIIKALGFSFWFMTFFIVSLYFYSIYKLFTRLDSFKTFALFILISLDSNLIIFEFRQCIAVSLFILSVLAFFEGKILKYLLLSLLSVLFHKSAVFAVFITFFVFLFKNNSFSKKKYLYLLILLVLFTFFSFKGILISVIEVLPVGESAIHSIEHHLSVGRKIQTIFFVYFFSIYSIYYYQSENMTKKKNQELIFIVFLIIAIFYQYWFFLNRFKSYFVPFMIVYVISEIQNGFSKRIIYKQLLVLSVYFFFCCYFRGLWESNKYSKNKVLESSTIFSLIGDSEEHIKMKNIQKASYFFTYEYLKDNKEENQKSD